MTDRISVEAAREAFATLPEGTSHGESPEPERVYLPPSHIKAMDPDTLLVTGMRGAGKTFWWSALQDPGVRQLVGQQSKQSKLSEDTEVRTGFGVRPNPDEYPSKDVLRILMEGSVNPRTIWRTVQAWQLADNDHPLRRRPSWADRVEYVANDPEAIERLFQERDAEFDQKGVYFLMLFDALDRCSDEWKEMYRAIRGLLQTALDMRSYQRLRVKVFLRSDQVSEAEIADFPDASKVLSSAVELNWPRRDLYALLWHVLGNGQHGDVLRTFLGSDEWKTVEVDPAGGKHVFTVPRQLVSDEDHQRERFHVMAGQWMGTDRRRGFPYTWIPNHLGDTEGRVSPRSFLAALRTAAEETTNQHPDHRVALHYNSIKSGVQEASKIRVSEIREDYPWVDRVLDPLRGTVVPCDFDEIEERWKRNKVLDHLVEQVKENEVKLPPSHIDEGAAGVRQDIESLGVFLRMRDGRINIPDVFRVGYGLGRRGGVRPVR